LKEDWKMGYELKMYVVSAHSFSDSKKEKVALVNGKVYHCFGNDEEGIFCFIDGKEHYISNEPLIETEWCEIIGMVDLCKCELKNTGICKFEEGDIYCFDNDGNSLIGLDFYGYYRKFVPIDLILDELKKLNKKEKYRRFTITISMLDLVKETFPDEKVGCIFFGH
jgi:hypothetical protein